MGADAENLSQPIQMLIGNRVGRERWPVVKYGFDLLRWHKERRRKFVGPFFDRTSVVFDTTRACDTALFCDDVSELMRESERLRA